jgi:aldehyde:ferredoxin oxidoreductase
MPYGYSGRILHIDLTKGILQIEKPDDAFYRKYLGGSAMGAYYLLKKTPPGADPLGPENTLSLMTGVVTGVPVSGQSRVAATAKSPLTGLVGDSQGGGFWPAALKAALFDGIVIQGRAEVPAYLWIDDGEAELRDATHLWGRVTAEVEDAIRAELGDNAIHVLQCGPAAEKGVRFGALISNCNRANGRTGMGTVMASKNLKAVAVRGSKRPEVADPATVRALAKWGADSLEESDVEGLGLLGTAEIVRSQNNDGGLPTRNWSSGSFEGAEDISGQRMHETIHKGQDTCYACVVRCKRVVEVTEGRFPVDPRYGGPEYETLSAMGSYCGVSDLAAVAHANQLCNMYGMDTITCGATIAWAMDCFEEGLLTTNDTDGLELRFGDAEALVKMVERIGKREGFGRVLGEGSAQAAEDLGVGHELVVAVKKNEYPAHMPQVKRSLALIYAVNPFGADHQSHEHDPSYDEDVDYGTYADRLATLDLLDPQPQSSLGPEKVRYSLYTQQLYSLLDSAQLCQFVWGPAWHLYGPKQIVDLVQAVTGWQVSLWQLMKVGERRLNMLRAFNAREGVGAEADTVPPKLLIPLKGGPSDGIALTMSEVEAAKTTYYGMAGWDERGRPTQAKLEELGIGWVARELHLP